MEIDFSGVERFFYAKRGSQPICPKCPQGKLSWLRSAVGDATGVSILAKGSGKFEGALHPAITMVCKSCGYLEATVVSIVEAWLESPEGKAVETSKSNLPHGGSPGVGG